MAFTGAFTIEMWVYQTASPTGGGYTIAGAHNSSGWLLQLKPTTTRFYITGSNLAVFSETLTNNTWYHLAVVREESAGVVKFYLDGTLKATSGSTPSTMPSNRDLFIGAYRSGSNSQNFQGYIDDFTIYNFAKYTANFTPPTSAATTTVSQTRNDLAVLYLPFDDGLEDKARNHSVTANGNAATSATQAKFGAKSLALDGTGDYLSISGVPALSQNPFTIQAFVYPAVVNTYQTLFDSRVNNSTNGGMTIQITNAAKIQVYAVTSSGTVNFTTSASISANSWQHIALVRSGTGSNETQIFIDGVSAGTLTLAGNLSLSSFNIGKTFDNYYLNGFIDDYRITTFAEYSANFTPPTAALSSEVLGTTTDTRTFSSVWNLNSPEVTEAFKAGTWPS